MDFEYSNLFLIICSKPWPDKMECGQCSRESEQKSDLEHFAVILGKIQDAPYDYAKRVDKDHDRIEIRQCWTISELS